MLPKYFYPILYRMHMSIYINKPYDMIRYQNKMDFCGGTEQTIDRLLLFTRLLHTYDYV